MRRPTRKIQIGTVAVGGDAPVSVQSMCSTDTRDVAATSAQIEILQMPDVKSYAALCPTKLPQQRLRQFAHKAASP